MVKFFSGLQRKRVRFEKAPPDYAFTRPQHQYPQNFFQQSRNAVSRPKAWIGHKKTLQVIATSALSDTSLSAAKNFLPLYAACQQQKHWQNLEEFSSVIYRISSYSFNWQDVSAKMEARKSVQLYSIHLHSWRPVHAFGLRAALIVPARHDWGH